MLLHCFPDPCYEVFNWLGFISVFLAWFSSSDADIKIALFVVVRLLLSLCLLFSTFFLSARIFCFKCKVNETWPGCINAVIKWLIYCPWSVDSALELVQSTGKKHTHKQQASVVGHRKRIFFHVTFGKYFREKFSIKTSFKALKLDDGSLIWIWWLSMVHQMNNLHKLNAF